MGVGQGGGGCLVAMFGVGVMWGMGEPRKEGIVKCTKKYCTILRKIKKCGGGRGAIIEPKTLSMYLKKIYIYI